MGMGNSESPAAIKAALRMEMRRRLSMLTAGERERASEQIRDLLMQAEFWQKSGSVLLYAPLADEPDLWPVVESALDSGKMVSLPRHDSSTDTYSVYRVKDLAMDVATGFYGIREPKMHCEKISLNQLDLIVAPGLAFSGAGYRLGRGKGYYDKLLAGFTGFKCGVGYEWQYGPAVPGENHDVHFNCILTPSHWQRIS